MDGYQTLGRLLIFAGAALVIIGVILVYAKGSLPLGSLPGDIVVRRPNFSFYFPITTSIILSLVLTLLFWLYLRFGR